MKYYQSVKKILLILFTFSGIYWVGLVSVYAGSDLCAEPIKLSPAYIRLDDQGKTVENVNITVKIDYQKDLDNKDVSFKDLKIGYGKTEFGCLRWYCLPPWDNILPIDENFVNQSISGNRLTVDIYNSIIPKGTQLKLGDYHVGLITGTKDNRGDFFCEPQYLKAIEYSEYTENEDYLPIDCQPNSFPTSGGFNCSFDSDIGDEGGWKVDSNSCKSGYVIDPVCSATAPTHIFSVTNVCVKCISEAESFDIRGLDEIHGTSCDDNNSLKHITSTYQNCIAGCSSLECYQSCFNNVTLNDVQISQLKSQLSSSGYVCKSGTTGSRYTSKSAITAYNECIIGYEDCSSDGGLSSMFVCEKPLNLRVNTGDMGASGEKGECIPEDATQLDQKTCTASSSACDDYLDEKNDAGKSLRDEGYIKGVCSTEGICEFYKNDADAKERQKAVDAGSNEPLPSPVIPAPPSRFIERCKGDLSCANCVARATVEKPSYLPYGAQFDTSKPFTSYSEAAALEYVYNQKVDEWKTEQAGDAVYTPAPKPTGFVYTGYIYTSLGCLDTTDNGLITRIVQIALGIIGSVILVRFAQAALKLQGGSSPEDKAEGIEIVTSAIVALLLFVMSMIVLRFIGVDLFQIFSPGSFEIG